MTMIRTWSWAFAGVLAALSWSAVVFVTDIDRPAGSKQSQAHPSHEIERERWRPEQPFAEMLAERGVPTILTNTAADRWSARRDWSSVDKLARLARGNNFKGVYHRAAG